MRKFYSHTKQSADAQHKQATEQVEQAITRSAEQVARDERIALERAERCILIDEKFPMVEGGNAFYNPRNRDSKGLLPANTALCSAQSGYTALVDEAGTVSSIKQAPIEKITPGWFHCHQRKARTRIFSCEVRRAKQI